MPLKIGLKVHGELNSSDASAGALVPLFKQEDNSAYTLPAANYLELTRTSLITVAGGDAMLFWDWADLASAEPIVGVSVDNGTFTVAGDRSSEFVAGRLFTVANSAASASSASSASSDSASSAATDNDGSYTTVSSVYSATTDQTTITVAEEVAVADVLGDITSTPLRLAGQTILRGPYTTYGGQTESWPVHAMPQGIAGKTVYCIAPAGVVNAMIEGLVQ